MNRPLAIALIWTSVVLAQVPGAHASGPVAIAPGKVADLVLLDADPRVDIDNTRSVRAVIVRGRLFDRAALDALLAQARAAASRDDG